MFDNICTIALGFEPKFLLPSFHEILFATTFDKGTRLSSQRLTVVTPLIWKVNKFLNIGTKRRLKVVVAEVRGLTRKFFRAKKRELEEKIVLLESVNLLSNFINSSHLDESFVIEIVISFIIAWRDTTSVTLT
ncbi:unnamed protein product [Vicia faba]|uniref:Uncharacterized protein n=1 Tax=Vicia faba TaxID=3906 RepID=A0AAV0ZWR1_VICFA|nr:unnamed protein product [Vicia faba]